MWSTFGLLLEGYGLHLANNFIYFYFLKIFLSILVGALVNDSKSIGLFNKIRKLNINYLMNDILLKN